jgi:hypothetical protein
MKTAKATGMIHKNIEPIMNIISSIFNYFSRENRSLPLQFVRLTEKFDTVEKSHYKDWVLRPNGR